MAKNFINKTQGNFTIVQNEILNSTLLSFEEKGLYTYLISKPDGWNFSSNGIQIDSKEKLGSIKRMLKSLENTGLLIRHKVKNSSGHFTGIVYEITDKITVSQKTDNGKTADGNSIDCKTSDGKTADGNPNNISNTINNNTDIEILNNNNTDLQNEFFEKNSPETKISDLSNNHQKEKRKKVAPKNIISNHQIIIDVYFDWFKQRNDSISPKIDGAEAKAAKTLANYFKSLQKQFAPDTTEEEMPEKIEKMFLRILNNWDNLEPFLQKQVKLIQINSNITNIVNYLKNGKQATNNNYKQQPVTDDTIASRFANFSTAFGTGPNDAD